MTAKRRLYDLAYGRAGDKGNIANISVIARSPEANQEQYYWLYRAQGKVLFPDLYKIAGAGHPAATPSLEMAWDAWHTVTEAADPYLESLTTEVLTRHLMVDGKPHAESIGSILRRVTYHYWYHMGEAQAIRQMLGHTNLPEFVGAIHAEAPYAPENAWSFSGVNTMAWEYCDLSGAVSRATNLLDLTIEYRNAPDKTNQQLIGLPRTELETTLRTLKDEGWQLESQCANPTAEWYTETYSFRRTRQTEG